MSRLGKKRSRWGRRVSIGLTGSVVATLGLWIAIHEIPGFGPALAEGVRSVVGPGPVAWAEDVAYGLQDRVNLWRFKDSKPKAFWDEPQSTNTPTSGAGVAMQAADRQGVETQPRGAGSGGSSSAAGFPPAAFEPPFSNVAGEGDGKWIRMTDPARPAEVGLAKSVVHPDPKRSFAAIAVVAIDLRRVDVRLMAGTTEPTSTTVPRESRPGLVPPSAMGDLIAVFNGGFRAMHGHYGMMIAGSTFLPPRDIACTVAFHRDGSIRIGTWAAVKGGEADMLVYRQTPPCLVEDGTVNKTLGYDEYNRNWGAAVGGETIIRRSAIGVDATGSVVFYGLGEAVTAPALARGMKAAGAHGVAQLDVNYSYPRFLLYESKSPTEPKRASSALIKDIKFTSYEYVAEPSPRDFFYLAWRSSEPPPHPSL